MKFARLDMRLATDRAGRAAVAEGLIGGVSPGPGAQGTKDGPLGVGPMPVRSEPLGSSISDHGSAGLPRCRPLGCPQGDALAATVHRFAVRRTIWDRLRNLPI
jgi:hypothetical protein